MPQVAVDPAYFAAATAAYIRSKAAADAQALADRDVAKRLDRIESRVSAPAPAAVEKVVYHDAEGRVITRAEAEAYEAQSEVKRGPEPPSSPPEPPGSPPELLRRPPPPAPDLTAVLGRNRCGTCHTGAAASKGFKIFEDDGGLVPLDIKAKQKIFGRTDPRKPKSMPPKGDRVSVDDRKTIAESILDDVAAAKAAVAAVEESIKE